MKAFTSTHLATFKSDDDPTARQGMTYPSALKPEFRKAKVGDVVGPYVDGKNYRIAKILDFNKNSLTVRHILVAASRGDQRGVFEAKLQTEKLMKEINHDNFEELVAKYSEDPGSKKKGGVYTDFLDYEMVPEFSKFAVEEEIGKIGYVQTDFGFHIMEVLERKLINLPVLAIISKPIRSSNVTKKEAQDKAEKIKNQLTERIDKESNTEIYTILKEVADEYNTFPIPLNLLDNSPILYGFDSINSLTLLRFAYNELVKPGDVLTDPIVQDDRYIIPVFIDAFKKGVSPYQEIKAVLRRDLIEEKKVRQIIEGIDLDINLEEIARNANTDVLDAEVRLGETGLSGKGYEPGLIGALFREGESNKMIIFAGKSGVYVVRIKSNSVGEGILSMKEMKNNLLKKQEDFVSGQQIQALRHKSTLVNNAILFHFGIRK
jgi:peptidyl-prolyl cis-trans isomerase D